MLKTMEQNGERHGVVSRIARQLDVGPETLRHWVRQAEIDRGTRAGATTDERERITETIGLVLKARPNQVAGDPDAARLDHRV